MYEYGIFKQKIVDGWQQERADNWLPGGQVWLKSHPDQAVEVRFDGEIHENWDNGFHYIQHTNYNSVMAVPSDMYVQGYDGKGVAKLRLWHVLELIYNKENTKKEKENKHGKRNPIQDLS